MNLSYYKIFFHGEFVGTAHGETKGEALAFFHNGNPEYS